MHESTCKETGHRKKDNQNNIVLEITFQTTFLGNFFGGSGPVDASTLTHASRAQPVFDAGI
jgi:hypothetical protein